MKRPKGVSFFSGNACKELDFYQMHQPHLCHLILFIAGLLIYLILTTTILEVMLLFFFSGILNGGKFSHFFQLLYNSPLPL